ncbi:tripartite tricarboxylate transporter substrate binding protein BugD [Alcaligenes sp. 13f]|nr:tripartite tricarboxylate transporter substrate binding protein BugD [Alcaligenes sp. 13f]
MLMGGSAISHAFPDRPITVVVPYAPGGSTDVLARILVDALGRDLGQPIVVQNMGGAGGTLGAAKVAKAKKDGYTILLHNMAMVTAPEFYSNPPYDVEQDFQAVALFANVPMILVRSKNFVPATVNELVAHMRRTPGTVNFAHAGVGSTSHLCALLFSQATSTISTLVGYRGTGPALIDLLAGTVDVICDQPVATASPIQSGGVLPYAISGEGRLSAMPNVPTFSEEGLGDFRPVVWHAMYVPKETSQKIVARLSRSVQVALSQPEVVQRYEEFGVQLPDKEHQTPTVAQTFTATEILKWSPILRMVGAKAD